MSFMRFQNAAVISLTPAQQQIVMETNCENPGSLCGFGQ